MKYVLSKSILLAYLSSILISGTVAAETDSSEAEIPSTQSLLTLIDRSESAEMPPPGPAAFEELFVSACSQCHDTERATTRQKSHEEWLMTVRRMADKPGANISPDEIEPIADYLTSLNPTEPETETDRDIPSVSAVLSASSVSLHATVSLLWRRGGQLVENEGFFPDVWAGGEWNPPDNPFSVQVMACSTCHDDGSGGMNAELLEGSFRADLIRLMTGESTGEREPGIKLEARAGRFSVPFGAYAGMAHPGVYRTLTNPLMYNMGRRVAYYEPVLPMPYADEGISLNLGIPLVHGINARFDGYAVNGLQEGGFTPSRSYRDNNSNAALGGRAVLGSPWFSIGGSYAAGELQTSGSPTKNYMLVGGDITLRYLQSLRLYYEYARREEDTAVNLESSFSGHVIEAEGRLWNKPGISLLIRYDTIRNSAAYGGATVNRVTWGPNITLPGGSLFIINHEHWNHDAPLSSEDIIGIRWVVSL